MSVIWLVSLSDKPNQKLALDLIGDYSVRAFASLKSMKILTKFQKLAPDAIILDATDLETDPSTKLASMINFMKEIPRFVFMEEAKRNALSASGHPVVESFEWLTSDASSLELSAAIRHALKRYEALGLNGAQKIQFEDIEVDLDGHELHLRDVGEVHNLTPKEAQILSSLILAPGRTMSREKLKQKIWRGVKISDRNMDSHISRIRAKLSNSGRTIESVYGAGYSIK